MNPFAPLVSLSVATLLLGATGTAWSQTIVTHPGVTLAAADVRDVYTGEKQFVGAIKLVPVDNSAQHDKFLASVIKADAGRYASIWAKRSFREGLSAPAVKSTDNEVLEYVRKTPGAVGYVSEGAKPSGVNVVK